MQSIQTLPEPVLVTATVVAPTPVQTINSQVSSSSKSIADQFMDYWNANPSQTIGMLIALFIGLVVIIKILFFKN